MATASQHPAPRCLSDLKRGARVCDAAKLLADDELYALDLTKVLTDADSKLLSAAARKTVDVTVHGLIIGNK